MARELDLSKPLSKSDVAYLRERYPESYVQRMIDLAGSPGTEDLIGETGTEEFDPNQHTVDEVNTYLESADDAEVQRVLAIEETGKNRAGILNR